MAYLFENFHGFSGNVLSLGKLPGYKVFRQFVCRSEKPRALGETYFMLIESRIHAAQVIIEPIFALALHVIVGGSIALFGITFSASANFI